jgi:hypothetical protein
MMIHDFDTAVLALRAGEVQRITDAAGSTVRIETGTVWVTQDSVHKDLVLEAGDTAVIESTGLVLLQAFAPTLVRVEAGAVDPAHLLAGARESAVAAVAAAGVATAGGLATLQPPAWQQARAAQALIDATRRMFSAPQEKCAGC